MTLLTEVDPLQLPLAVDLTAVVVGALAGAGVAVRERLDLVGGLILAVATGLGGGIVRDLLLGQRPVAVSSHAYLPTVAVAALAGLAFATALHRVRRLVIVLDAVALGLFTVVGVEKALLASLPMASAVFVGVCAGISGGIVADLLSGQPVTVVRRGPWYATAALAGATVYALSSAAGAPSRLSEAVCVVVVLGMRLVSLRYGVRNPESLDVVRVIPVRRVRPDDDAASSAAPAPPATP